MRRNDGDYETVKGRVYNDDLGKMMLWLAVSRPARSVAWQSPRGARLQSLRVWSQIDVIPATVTEEARAAAQIV